MIHDLFGVEVARRFAGEGGVTCGTTPAGEATVVVHRGLYSKLATAHQALHQWCAGNNRTIGPHSLKIYRDRSDNLKKLKTTIGYLLK